MTAANGRANGSALDNPRELVGPMVTPPAAMSSSTAPQFSTGQMKEWERSSVREAVGPRCGYEGDRYELPCGAPATVTDIETGCTFCANHFREVILRSLTTTRQKRGETFCVVCAELTRCYLFAAEYPEQETGYVDERVAMPGVGNGRCADESPLQKPHRVAANACSRPKQTDEAIEFLNQEKGAHPL